MLRLALIPCLLAFAVFLPAQGQDDDMFNDGAADEWQREFRDWVKTECEQERHPETWFPDDEGRPVRHRILGVKDGRLAAAALTPTTRKDAQGNPVMEKGDEVYFDWKDWKPRYIVSTYGTTGREDGTLIAFAVWLYRGDQPLLGNRVLTAVHDRNDEFRDRIEAFIRDREQIAEGEKLIVVEVWDDEFKRLRRVLMSEKAAAKRERAIEEEATYTILRLVVEYDDSEERTLTLNELNLAIDEWRERYAGTKTAERRERSVDRLQSAIKRDVEAVRTHVESAKDEQNLKKRAEEFDKALKLDPASTVILSKAAGAWMEHANPEVRGGTFMSTHESAARKAGELFQRWLDAEPDNAKVMLNRAVCHHVIGNRTEAQALYHKVIELDTDGDSTAAAKRYKDLD